ncbi:MAG: hypothetical protein MMC23_000416 [Stictis urceolatum]|nr:hypothetical protein [Stictis urceolata]
MQQEYDLLPATPEDAAVLGAIESEAIQSSPLNTVFFRNWAGPKAQSAALSSLVLEQIQKPNVRVMRAVRKEDGSSPTACGFLVWWIVDGSDEQDPIGAKTPEPSAVMSEDNAAGSDYRYSSTPQDTENPRNALNLDFCNIAFANVGHLKAHILAGQRRYACCSSFQKPKEQDWVPS